MGITNESILDEYPCLEPNKVIQSEKQNENNDAIHSLSAIFKLFYLYINKLFYLSNNALQC